MKKLLYTLSLALIGGLAANAATPALKPHALSNQPMLLGERQSEFTKAVKVDNKGSKKVKAKGKKSLPSSVDEYFGNWQWVGDNCLSGVVLPNEGIMTISQMEGSDSILIKGLDMIADSYTPRGGLAGYFENGRLYIPEQITSFDDNPFQGDEPTKWFCWTLRSMTPAEKEAYEQEHGPGSAEGVGYLTEASPEHPFFLALLTDESGEPYLTSVYYEDPNAPRTDEVMAESWTAASAEPLSRAGYWWFDAHIEAVPMVLFSFYPNEWKEIGTALFNDPWLANLFEWTDPSGAPTNPPTWDVPLYRNVLNPNKFLLFDPYGPGTPVYEDGLTSSSDEGYLIFDITDPNLVVFQPLVYSFSSDFNSYYGMQEYYNYNLEGYYYFLGGTPLEDIAGIFLDRDKEPSYFDESDLTVYIYNPVFDMIPAIGFSAAANWGNFEGYVILPEDYDDPNASVGAIGDDSNAVPVYYNLQGLRVNNPEKGQLLIVKKGNKTVKQVIR